ncbi:MAG: LysR family transcriptional regulator [Candidatus Dormibacteraeota bacterium]|nr:LysR family transcriptional regulator [Candidatus Dormibacteraeota bacterium]MBO0762796.1 LysR family transcriptional regulator [Candidatus Dormibacteraeota bacterium]
MVLANVEGFLEVAQLGSVSRAAAALAVTQPTLTARLHTLERALGAQLFVRTRQGMRLTEAGRAFLPHAERAVRALREGQRAILQLESGVAGQLLLAAAPAVSTYVLPLVLERFVDRYPNVEVAVRTGHSEDVLQMVLHDEVQIGLGRALHHPEVELRPFHEEELVLVVPPDHPFARRPRVTLSDLTSEQLILFDRTSSYYEITQAAFLSSGVTIRSMMELDNIEAAKRMVERGLGVALLPRSAVVEQNGETPLLQPVELADAPTMRRTLVAMRRADQGPPSGLVAAFLELLEGDAEAGREA